MTKCTPHCWKALLLLLGVLVMLGCWPRISKERLPDELSPTSLLEAYPYAQEKTSEWSATAFLEGANVGYKWRDDTWKPYGLSYVFVDAEQREYVMVVINLEDRVVQIHPPARIDRSMVSTFPFFLEDNPIGEQEALEIADNTLGNQVTLSCRNPEVAVRGSGFGEDQHWGITYMVHDPLGGVMGEISINAVTGEVVTLKDLTQRCDR